MTRLAERFGAAAVNDIAITWLGFPAWMIDRQDEVDLIQNALEQGE